MSSFICVRAVAVSSMTESSQATEHSGTSLSVRPERCDQAA